MFVFRSSTISNSSTSTGEKPNPDGSEAAENDFMYETNCSLETKRYEMGKIVDNYEVPTTVQELSNGNVDKAVSTSSISRSSSSKVEQESKSSNSFKVLTSLPPLPRSHSANKFDHRRDYSGFSKTTETTKESMKSVNTYQKCSEVVETNTVSKTEVEEVTLMDPVEVKIKTRGNTNFNSSEENVTGKQKEEKEHLVNNDVEIIYKAEPAIIISNADISHDNKGKLVLISLVRLALSVKSGIEQQLP